MDPRLQKDIDAVEGEFNAGSGGKVKGQVEEKTSKIGSGRLLGKGLGGALSAMSTVKNAMPGHEIMTAGVKRVGGAAFEALPDAAQLKAKDAAKSVGKKVAQSEVGRQVTLGVVQGKKGADDKFASASDTIDSTFTGVGKARDARKAFKRSIPIAIFHLPS